MGVSLEEEGGKIGGNFDKAAGKAEIAESRRSARRASKRIRRRTGPPGGFAGAGDGPGADRAVHASGHRGSGARRGRDEHHLDGAAVVPVRAVSAAVAIWVLSAAGGQHGIAVSKRYGRRGAGKGVSRESEVGELYVCGDAGSGFPDGRRRGEGGSEDGDRASVVEQVSE